MFPQRPATLLLQRPPRLAALGPLSMHTPLASRLAPSSSRTLSPRAQYPARGASRRRYHDATSSPRARNAASSRRTRPTHLCTLRRGCGTRCPTGVPCGLRAPRMPSSRKLRRPTRRTRVRRTTSHRTIPRRAYRAASRLRLRRPVRQLRHPMRPLPRPMRPLPRLMRPLRRPGCRPSVLRSGSLPHPVLRVPSTPYTIRSGPPRATFCRRSGARRRTASPSRLPRSSPSHRPPGIPVYPPPSIPSHLPLVIPSHPPTNSPLLLHMPTAR